MPVAPTRSPSRAWTSSTCAVDRRAHRTAARARPRRAQHVRARHAQRISTLVAHANPRRPRRPELGVRAPARPRRSRARARARSSAARRSGSPGRAPRSPGRASHAVALVDDRRCTTTAISRGAGDPDQAVPRLEPAERRDRAVGSARRAGRDGREALAKALPLSSSMREQASTPLAARQTPGAPGAAPAPDERPRRRSRSSHFGSLGNTMREDYQTSRRSSPSRRLPSARREPRRVRLAREHARRPRSPAEAHANPPVRCGRGSHARGARRSRPPRRAPPRTSPNRR